MRGRIHEHHPIGRPHQVPAPQVAVNPGRRITIVEVACATTIHHGIDGVQYAAVQLRRRPLSHREQALVGVELTPADMLGKAHRQRVL